MLYTLNLDQDNFVLSIAHTKNDNVELNLDDVDLHYLAAYQYIDGALVLNAERKAEIVAEEEEEERKKHLPTWNEIIESQTFYTAMMTDTLLEE